MEIKIIKVSKKFEKQYKHIPKNIKNQAKEKESVFRKNPFDKILNTHKLHGKEKDIWSFNINYSYRIKFIFLSDEEVLFLEMGTHKIYK